VGVECSIFPEDEVEASVVEGLCLQMLLTTLDLLLFCGKFIISVLARFNPVKSSYLEHCLDRMDLPLCLRHFAPKEVQCLAV
jgi:hypothetical protein